MDGRQDVSPNVSLDVALADSQRASASSPSARSPADPLVGQGTSSAPGRHLVRSGSIYLFQIRMPNELEGDRYRTVRISLGALTAREARRKADLLGVLARNRFDQLRAAAMERRRQAGSTDGDDGTLFANETPN